MKLIIDISGKSYYEVLIAVLEVCQTAGVETQRVELSPSEFHDMLKELSPHSDQLAARCLNAVIAGEGMILGVPVVRKV